MNIYKYIIINIKVVNLSDIFQNTESLLGAKQKIIHLFILFNRITYQKHELILKIFFKNWYLYPKVSQVALVAKNPLSVQEMSEEWV